jgi:deoxyribonuclease V
VEDPAPYEPGRFYRRELPALLAVLSKFTLPPEVVIIDGYVWLGDWDHPGLGAHLHKALGGSVAVIGVAKKLFLRGPAVQTIRRGNSARPLYVSTAGMDLNEAAARIVGLHGEFRLPTLLKRVDRLCRGYPDALESDLVKRSPSGLGELHRDTQLPRSRNISLRLRDKLTQPAPAHTFHTSTFVALQDLTLALG